ncbi:hypothetical protein [Geobacter sp. DSM 9736]|uniref:hypothetical protein n=1 Tax=Geobacter sp. DSM 9736 TaxID=1277350 RepID=UPI000B4FE6BD|nr:hypothetical protein [Geobacter sp. DSM 9736]
MNRNALFSATLGLSSPWKIVCVSFRNGEKRVDISVDFDICSPFSCPLCGSETRVTRTVSEQWHYPDFFNYAAYFYVRTPYLSCLKGCGHVKAERPWPKENSLFTLIPHGEEIIESPDKR